MLMASLNGNNFDEYQTLTRKSYYDSLFLILKGRADVVMRDWNDPNIEYVVDELRPGSVFGVSDLLRVVVSSVVFTYCRVWSILDQ